jgi:SlyX protein
LAIVAKRVSIGRTMTAQDDEERFQILETRVAYQEKELAELNDVVFRQQRALDALGVQLKKVSDQMRDLGFRADDTKDQPPPHY